MAFIFLFFCSSVMIIFSFRSQDRKKFFPPRPRGNRKARNSKKKSEPPVKLENLKSALSGLSQDSGIGSSQEMCADLLFASDHLKSGTSDMPSSSSSSSAKISRKPSVDEHSKSTRNVSSTEFVSMKNNRKRYISESSLSDFEVKKPKLEQKPSSQSTPDFDSEIVTSSYTSPSKEKEKPPDHVEEKVDVAQSTADLVGKSAAPPMQNEKENSELCIICNNAPKDSIFLHTNIAHQCCCYRCAKRTLYTIKRCPICNRSVNKVVKIYTS